MRQTKITDYFKPSSNQTNQTEITDYFKNSVEHDKLVKLRNKCVQIRDECKKYTYDQSQFIGGDLGTLAEYVLALGDKLSLIINN